MDTYLCPKGHQSTEPDYCSECGAKIEGGAAGSLNGGAPAAAGQVCPDCGTRREDPSIAFCEICGYNFVTGAHGELPMAPAQSAPAPVPTTPVAAPAAVEAAPAPGRWTVVVSLDPTLREAGSPEPPANMGPFTFDLDKPVTLVGRRSEARAIFPEIPLAYDDAVSHRHALLELTPEGALMVRDIGSANGTRLNGKELPAMVDTPLNDGDEITLGHWSRIAIKADA